MGTSNLSDKDEYLHVANERIDWRESYYFNWVDIDTGISGFSTIGLLPNAKKREFVFVLFYDNIREVHFNELDGPFANEISESLTDGSLSYHLESPLSKWRISYHGKHIQAEIVWPARFPAYDFGTGSGTSWVGHFEQSGAPYGCIELSDGRVINIQCLGERDKSWGSRDWHIDSWFALHAQFEDVSIGLRRDVVDNNVHSSGGISNVEGHTPIVDIKMTTEKHKKSGIPIGAKVEVEGRDGSVYNLRSRLISSESFIRFDRKFEGGSTELFEAMAIHECEELDATGTGLLEWLYTHTKIKAQEKRKE